MPKLVITEGPGQGAEYKVEKALILGRLDTNDVPVKDVKASREHAKVFIQGQEFAIVDLNSSNGTFVNGQKITKRVLKNGDEISIGLVKILFDAAEEEKAKSGGGARRATLDEAFQKKGAESARKGGASPAAGARPGEISMVGHKPLQFNQVRRGRPLLGIDMEQMSDTTRLAIYLLAIGFFGLILYVVYSVVASD